MRWVSRRDRKERIRDVLDACCGGIDVPAKMFVACLLKGGKKDMRTFATMTEDLLRRRAWLTQAQGARMGPLRARVCIGAPFFISWKGPWT